MKGPGPTATKSNIKAMPAPAQRTTPPQKAQTPGKTHDAGEETVENEAPRAGVEETEEKVEAEKSNAEEETIENEAPRAGVRRLKRKSKLKSLMLEKRQSKMKLLVQE